MDVLEVKNLHKAYGDKKVLQGIDFSVREHSIFGFIGRNGAGKTTTMKAILGLLKVDEGEIYVCGEKVSFGAAKTNRYIGYLPDVPEFYSFMTAREYLLLCGETLGMSKRDIKARSDELLFTVGLADEKHRIKGYSRGMKQRLGIAQALFGKPKLLICDEPTSALDPIGRKEILDVLLSVQKETTVFFSTHILTDVERICTDIALINNGRVDLNGSIDDLKQIGRKEEFLVELANRSSTLILQSAFCAQLVADDVLLFSGGDDFMRQVMGFIKEKNISVNKIERINPTLESLFVEVIKK